MSLGDHAIGRCGEWIMGIGFITQAEFGLHPIPSRVY